MFLCRRGSILVLFYFERGVRLEMARDALSPEASKVEVTIIPFDATSFTSDVLFSNAAHLLAGGAIGFHALLLPRYKIERRAWCVYAIAYLLTSSSCVVADRYTIFAFPQAVESRYSSIHAQISTTSQCHKLYVY